MKQEKGITLVALIITIIVMLILVAVSVAVLVDSDLIGTAENAGEEWEAADDQMEDIASRDIIDTNNDGIPDKSVNSYFTSTEETTPEETTSEG